MINTNYDLWKQIFTTNHGPSWSWSYGRL